MTNNPSTADLPDRAGGSFPLGRTTLIQQPHRELLDLDEDPAEGHTGQLHGRAAGRHHQALGSKDVRQRIPAVPGQVHALEAAGGHREGRQHHQVL